MLIRQVADMTRSTITAMWRPIFAASALVLALGACSHAPDRHERPGPIELAQAETGEVLAVRAVDLGGSDTLIDDGAGARIGGYAGLVIGSFIGEGSGRALGALIGLGTGALAGALFENELERKSATEYLIRLQSGEEIVVLTRGSAQAAPGQSVRVINRGHGYSVVIPAPA